ncbi:MAG: PrsW family glutamic-type intramembrane protease [Patescibacteria group bacterium]
MTNDPKILGLALLGGVLPALIWLWFWLRENDEKPEPKGTLILCFLLGMIAVIIVLPIEKFLQTHINSQQLQIVSWASVEELVKYLVIFIALFNSTQIKSPLDYAIYIITTALGFAALENTFFLIKPLSLDHSTVGLLTSQLRFLGSTLLHSVSSGLIGISLGLAFYMGQFAKKIYLFIGIIAAIALHTAFNFFIIENNGNNFLSVFALLWVVTVINMLLLEKLRRMSGEY